MRLTARGGRVGPFHELLGAPVLCLWRLPVNCVRVCVCVCARARVRVYVHTYTPKYIALSLSLPLSLSLSLSLSLTTASGTAARKPWREKVLLVEKIVTRHVTCAYNAI